MLRTQAPASPWLPVYELYLAHLGRERAALLKAAGPVSLPAAFPQVAAEAAGVPAEVFEEWMRRGTRPEAPEPCQDLVAAVRHGQAHARFMADPG